MGLFSPPLDSLRTNLEPVRLGVLASGSGSNFEAIVDACRDGVIRGEVVQVICNNSGARVFERAERLKVRAELINHRDFDSRSDFDGAIVSALNAANVEWVAMAGWMRISTPVLVEAYAGRMLNLHPSLLPAFPGFDAVGQTLAANVKITGCTVHRVTSQVDGGPIVAQAALEVRPEDDRSSLHERIHTLEHELFAPAIAHAISEQE